MTKLSAFASISAATAAVSLALAGSPIASAQPTGADTSSEQGAHASIPTWLSPSLDSLSLTPMPQPPALEGSATSTTATSTTAPATTAPATPGSVAGTRPHTGTVAAPNSFNAQSPTGVDVSKWQRPGGAALNWEKVAASGEKFAFIKATDGIEGRSAYYVEDSLAAARAGIIIGSYHKAHPDRSAIAQADDYAAALQAVRAQAPAAKMLPPVLDIELQNGLSTQELKTWTRQFLERIQAKTGVQPMIYTYRWFWQQPMGNTTEFSHYPLWLAAYQNQPPSDIPGGWQRLTFWQRSSTGRVDGIPTIVDLNTFNGTTSELEALTW